MEQDDFLVPDSIDIPLISIVMPVKDTASYLPACLDSILAQSFTHWELVAVNDYSSDDSLEILQSYADKDRRIRIFNGVQPSLLNTLRYGYQNALGDLIHRMDSDDKMPVYKLEEMVNAWLRHGKGCVITGGTRSFIDNEEIGNGFKRYDQWLCKVAQLNTHKEEMYRECVVPSSCWLVHREDFDNVEGFEPAIFPEDYDLCFRFYKGKLKIVGLDQVLHHWRDRSDRISRNWDCYKDNRFFALKINYFFSLERDASRPLVLWGAGKNGKDLAKLIRSNENKFNWVCDNEKKIGKDIYGLKMQHFDRIETLISPQIIIAVASPEGQIEIQTQLNNWRLVAGKDYWFFA
ncbi:MAG: glycosyltransferase [Crocinitomicaceae bacterium]|nr:glycosyltransferase [Crocinitomicaceae bacterium]